MSISKDVSVEDEKMKLIGECIVGKKKAKEGFEYPIIRFPKEFAELIGKRAVIYQIDEKNFIVSLELAKWLDNHLELLKIDKNLLQKAKELGIDISSFLEEKIKELLNNVKADPAGFEPATLGLGGPRPVQARLRVL